MAAGKISVEQIGNGGAKTPVADKLPSCWRDQNTSVWLIPYGLLPRLPFRAFSMVSIKLRASEHLVKTDQEC
jgi:hypothetical protein